ncbi:MAG TPA: hypothetical protein PKH24_04240 [Sedimentisphaerales bacterium]|nr:hypothetical protein [Sedimentisphaerales bacterium]HNU29974.1 hypothetical protein [Sedimentisphaerales bacterium]
MNRRRFYLVLVLAAAGVACLAASGPAVPDQASPVGRPARIEPDYGGVVIPPNIAPLNFLVRESGSRYRVRIASQQGDPIRIDSRSAKIAIPERSWRRLLSENRGQELAFEVQVQTADGWRQFDVFRTTVASEDIDDYLVYRRIHPAHSAWRDMGIYQRDLRTFEESTILTNDYFRGGCVNCHTFCNNRTDTMLVSTRSGAYGNAAVILKDGLTEKVGSTFGYASWHPNGKVLAYTSMKVAMFLHAAGEEVRDVIDLNSLLAYYDAGSRKIKTAPDLAKKDRLETYPTWSPDGRFLYFCSAPLTWTSRNAIPEKYSEIRYDLMRIPYDPNTDTWGQAETVLAAQEMGRSILLPRISPDGRWLLLSLCDYGCFPVYRKSSDLYLIDLEAPGTRDASEKGRSGLYSSTESLGSISLKNGRDATLGARPGFEAEKSNQEIFPPQSRSDLPFSECRYEARRLEINSDQSESWHSWSSNSRWIAFSSKRGNGTFTRTYFSYVDPNGVAHKPFVLPQKDPTHYDSCLWTYSVPELVTEPVRVTKESLGRVVRSSRKVSVEMPITTATPKPEKAPEGTTPYLAGRE